MTHLTWVSRITPERLKKMTALPAQFNADIYSWVQAESHIITSWSTDLKSIMVVYIGKTFAGQIYQFSQVVLAESLKMLIGVE